MITAGRAGSMPWEEAADALADAIAPVRAHAAASNLPLGFEHMNPLRSDVGFVHTLRDAVDLAIRLDVQVLMEVNNCWAERGLRDTIINGVDPVRFRRAAATRRPRPRSCG